MCISVFMNHSRSPSSMSIFKVFLFCCSIISICGPSLAVEGSLRLVGGSGPHEGRVEIYLNGEWGTVCDNSWDIEDATVVCRQLGYPTTLVAVASAGFGEGTGEIWMTDVSCIGTELNLTDCTSGGLGWEYCGHSRDAGVVCSATTAGDDCPTLHVLFEEAYESGRRTNYNNPYGWLEDYGYGVYIPQCLQDGSFATVQCSNTSLPINTTALPDIYSSYARSRYCWCVDPATGIPTTTREHFYVPSPEECPYYDTATLCQSEGDYYYSGDSTCLSSPSLLCNPGVPQSGPVVACAPPNCGPYVTAVYDGCSCGRCPSVAGLAPAQYIPLSVGLTALVIVLAIIGAGLGGICCVHKCWHPEKKGAPLVNAS